MNPDEGTCEICGTKAGHAPPARDTDPSGYKRNMKSEALAILISALLPGLGILYTGQAKGLLYFLGFIIFSAIMFFVPLGFVLVFLGWLFLIYKSYETARNYNRYLMTNGHPPW
jgi:hypothetical protein